MKHTLPILFTMLLCGTSAFPQEGCYSRLQNDTLTIGNSRIERRFVWNGGNLMTQSLTDFSSGQVWTSRSLTPDFKVAGDTRSTGGRCSTKRIAETDIHPARLEITVEFSLGTLDVRRIYRICADTPGDRLRHLPQRQRRRTASRQPGGQRRRPQEHRIDRRHAVAAGRRDPRPVQPRRVPLAHADRGVPGRHGLEQQPGLRNRRHSLPEKQLPGQPALRPQRRERPRILLPEGSPRFGRATGLWRRGLHGGVRRFHGDGTGRDGEGPPRRGVGESLRMASSESGRAENSNS